jgi:hypothetical protein
MYYFSFLDNVNDQEERELMNERPENPEETKLPGKKSAKCVCEICERVFSRKDSLLQVSLIGRSSHFVGLNQ